MIVLNDSMVSLCIYSEIVQLCNTSFIDEVAVVPQCSIVTLMCQNEEHRKTLIKKGRKNQCVSSKILLFNFYNIQSWLRTGSQKKGAYSSVSS